MEKYYKNFILCGEADFYCILCQESCIDFEIVEKHLRWLTHRNRIKKQEYVHKLKRDYIYKITDENFYCEVCNLVIQNAVDHIKESSHQELKISNKNKKKKSNVQNLENGLIEIGNQIFTRLQWNGISDDMCLLCDESVEKVLTHVHSFNHMVKLIQAETISENNQHYRKLEKNKFYCFTCFKVFENKLLDTHWADNHKENEHPVQEMHEKNAEEHSNTNDDLNNNEDSMMIKLIKKMQKENFSFDVENKATCLECNEVLELNYDAVINHRKTHLSTDEEECEVEDEDESEYDDEDDDEDEDEDEDEDQDEDEDFTFEDKGKKRAKLARYGRANFIILNKGGSKGICSICNVYLSAHMNVAKQHVEGAVHQGHLELKGLITRQEHEKPAIKGIPYKRFLDVMFGPFEIDNVSVICMNDGICVNTLSLMLVTTVCEFGNNDGTCYACNQIMDCLDLNKHIKTKEHKNIVLGCKVYPVATKDDDEFIRQIRPGLFHCGYCNRVFPFWENMLKHLKSFQHDVKRQKAKLMSSICAKKYLDPSYQLSDMEEYFHLRQIDFFE